MKHINDIEIIEYAAGKLTPSRDKEVIDHMAACEECSNNCQKAVELWNTLGQWRVDTAGHDVAERIMFIAEEEQRGRKQYWKAHNTQKGYVLAVVRVAASIIIAIGVGHKLGKYSVISDTPKAAISQKRPEYLTVLGLEWSSELAWFILEDNSPNMGEER